MSEVDGLNIFLVCLITPSLTFGLENLPNIENAMMSGINQSCYEMDVMFLAQFNYVATHIDFVNSLLESDLIFGIFICSRV